MNEWYKKYNFKRDWKITEEALGLLRYCSPNAPYAAIISALYYADRKSLNLYGNTITYDDHFHIQFNDDDDILKIISYFEKRIPIPMDILERINYDTIIPLSSNRQWLTSRANLDVLQDVICDLPDVVINCLHFPLD